MSSFIRCILTFDVKRLKKKRQTRELMNQDNALSLRVVVSGTVEVQEIFAEFTMATMYRVSCLPSGWVQSRKIKMREVKLPS